MQTGSKFMDDMSRLMVNAMDAAPGAREEADTALRCTENRRLRRLSAAPAPHARSSGLVETWSFLSVAKASIPCQEIGSHYKSRC